MADLVHSDVGVIAWLAFSEMWRRIGRDGTAAQTGTHELLPGGTGHATRLHVAVLDPQLLRVELRAGGHREYDQHRRYGDKKPFIDLSPGTGEFSIGQHGILDFSEEFQSVALRFEILK